MTPAEQRELTIWGGAALGVIVIATGWLWYHAGDDEYGAARAASLHETYRSYYHSDDPGRLARDRATALVGRVSEEQEGEWAIARSRQVFPGQGGAGVPREIGNSVLMGAGYFANDIDYTIANGIVGNIIDRLRSRARSLGAQIRNKLPFEADTNLDNGHPAKRALQMAQFTALAMSIERLLDVGVEEIEQTILQPPESLWRDPTSEVASIGIGLKVNGTYQAIDLFMRTIAEDRNGLALDDLLLVQNDRKLYEATLRISLLVPYRKDWDLPERRLVGVGELPRSEPVGTAAAGPRGAPPPPPSRGGGSSTSPRPIR